MRRLLLRTDRLYLVLPAVVPMAIDFAVTLLGQHPRYWDGYRLVEESTRLWRSLMFIHPAAFVAGGMLYAGIAAVGIYFLPKLLAWWLSIVLLVTHVSGARSWLWKFSGDHFVLWEVTLHGSMALLATVCYLKASRQRQDLPLLFQA